MMIKMYNIVCALNVVIGIASAINLLVRSDGKCGPLNPLSDGSPSQCDPKSTAYCCSDLGICGSTTAFCDCPDCVNYKALTLDGSIILSLYCYVKS